MNAFLHKAFQDFDQVSEQTDCLPTYQVEYQVKYQVEWQAGCLPHYPVENRVNVLPMGVERGA